MCLITTDKTSSQNMFLLLSRHNSRQCPPPETMYVLSWTVERFYRYLDRREWSDRYKASVNEKFLYCNWSWTY